MSWEAFRLTSKSPGELLATLGPHGVDHLIRQALDTLWREHPADTRSLQAVTAAARTVFGRNLKVWAAIKKPSPDAFFQDLLPRPTDQFLRQAMVVAWMMMPRAGGRDVADVRKIITRIYERNLEAWEEDNATFTGEKKAKAKAKKPTTKPKKPAAKKAPARKSKAKK